MANKITTKEPIFLSAQDFFWVCGVLVFGVMFFANVVHGQAPQIGVCGPGAGTTVATEPTGASACTTGTYTNSPADTATQWNWTCAFTISRQCSANKIVPINGSCGSGAGTMTVTEPTGSSACATGTYTNSPADTATQWNWTCAGSNGGTSQQCSASLPTGGSYYWRQVGSQSGRGFGECVSARVSCDFGVPTSSCIFSDLNNSWTETYTCGALNLGNTMSEVDGTICGDGSNTGTWGQEYYECSWAPSTTATLTTSISSGQGTISAPGVSCPGDCTQTFNYGDWVTITATPNSAGGFSFGSWSGACLGQTSSCSIQMNGDRSTSVSFNAPSAPTVSLNANPNPVAYNTASSLSWSSTNATSCTASGAWFGPKALSGTQSTGNLTSNQTYTLDCTGPGGTASRDVTVAVLPSSAITVSCDGDPDIALLGQNITWTAIPNGGSGSYTYSWSGTNIPTSPAPSTNPYVKSYSTIGQKTAQVVVTDSVSAQQATCNPAAVVEIKFDPDFEEF